MAADLAVPLPDQGPRPGPAPRVRCRWTCPALTAVTYDGDSPPEQRAWARRHANVILTNPDMLHAGILPFHGRWANFLRRLRYVVLDELHTLRGVYGTHVAHLMRRLRRLCALYGSSPVFVCCSATIGSPAALASAITGVACHAGGRRRLAVGATGSSPCGIRRSSTGRQPGSAHGETARLLAGLVGGGHRAIAFTRSRRGAEVVAAARPRAGCPPTWRRPSGPTAAATSPRSGGRSSRSSSPATLRGVAATNALELGVDIGGLDACILDGFPGTIASMWQQAGRAGRACEQSLAVLVAGEDALDQWLMAHPDELFTRAPGAGGRQPGQPVRARPARGLRRLRAAARARRP